MPIAYTSREALCAVLAELTERQREVYDCIAEWNGDSGAEDADNRRGPSIEDIARAISRKECSVCARVNELLAAGAIELAPMKINATGHKAKTYTALVFRAFNPPTPPQAQQDLFAAAVSPGHGPYETRV